DPSTSARTGTSNGRRAGRGKSLVKRKGAPLGGRGSKIPIRGGGRERADVRSEGALHSARARRRSRDASSHLPTLARDEGGTAAARRERCCRTSRRLSGGVPRCLGIPHGSGRFTTS